VTIVGEQQRSAVRPLLAGLHEGGSAGFRVHSFPGPRAASPVLDRVGVSATVGLDHVLQYYIESQDQDTESPCQPIDSPVLLFSYV
jgi:hypothetical protein